MSTGIARRVAPWLVLLNITLLGLMLRLYRLDEQSVWFDELNSLLIDSTAGFSAFMRHIRMVSPDHVPLYYVLMYLWGKYISLDPVTMRMVSIAFACATIPVVFLIGRRTFGVWAGLVAALCLALSPLNLFEAQAIRCNAMLTFLAALSILLTFHVGNTPRWRWILVHAALNTVMLFTHLTSATLIMMEYLFLVIYLGGLARARLAETRRVIRILAGWAALHVPAALYSVYWFVTLESTEGDWFTLPGPLAWLTDLLGDDAVHFSDEFAQSALNYELAPRLHRPLWEWTADFAYLAIMGAALLWGVAQCVRTLRGEAGVARIRHLSERGFLLLLVLGPIGGITLMSLVWYPVLQARYTLYSSLALYCLVGGLVCSVRGRAPRTTAVAMLVALYAVQLGHVLPGHTRTNWLGAAAEITAQGRDNAPIFSLYYMPKWHALVPTPADMLRYNLGKEARPVRTVHTFAGALEQVKFAMSQSGGARRCWILVENLADYWPEVTLEEELMRRGFQVWHWKSTSLHLYLIRHTVAPIVPPGNGEELGPKVENLLAKYAPELADTGTRATVGHAMMWAVPAVEDNDDLLNPLTLGLNAMEMAPEAGIAMAEHALAVNAQHDGALLLLGLGRLALGDEAAARESFAKISEKRREYFLRRWPGLEWTMLGKHARARASYEEVCRIMTSRIVPFLRYLYGLETPPTGSTLRPLAIDATAMSGNDARDAAHSSL
jgi:4-amino-4-deoxy-L-arabinose transferase-like glycosyltransferase